jgi:hypothetical protein
MSDHKKPPPRPHGTLTVHDVAGLGQAGHFAEQISAYVTKTMVTTFQKGVNTNNMARGAGGRNWTNPFGRFDEADDLLKAHGSVEQQYISELNTLAAMFTQLGKGLKAAGSAYATNEANTTADLTSLKPDQLHLTSAQQKQVGVALDPAAAASIPTSPPAT